MTTAAMEDDGEPIGVDDIDIGMNPKE